MMAISDESDISLADRAGALLAANGLCCMCARTIVSDWVKLFVEHKRPREWGVSGDLTNLWAVCGPCHGVKSTLLSSLRTKIDGQDVHVRIGETLKAVGVGEGTPSWLLEIVADQANWRARLRELREPGIGWEIEARRRRVAYGRILADYILRREGKLVQ